MTTNVLLVLDARRPKPDGTFRLVLRIVHNRTIAEIRLNRYLNLKDWDEDKRTVKSTYKGTESVVRLNNYLQKKKTELIDFITKLDEERKLSRILHAKDLRDLYLKPSQSITSPSFLAFLDSMVKSMEEKGKIGNARTYKSAKNALKKYFDKDEITFDEVNADFLEAFETAHLAKGNSINGLSVYLRTIRAVWNKAIKTKLVSREAYPFAEYEIKTAKTRKRAISHEAIKRIEELQLEESHSLFNARNYFLFSYYMRGLPFADLAHLKRSNIVDRRIIYARQKTAQPLDVKIIPKIQVILSYYLEKNEGTEYIFGIIKRTTPDDIYKDVLWARKRYNKKLKLLAELCGIETSLTSYVSRHSFASRARSLKVPIKDISEMLGHDRITTTEVYLANLPNDEMDDYHKKIVEGE
jgi:integrase